MSGTSGTIGIFVLLGTFLYMCTHILLKYWLENLIGLGCVLEFYLPQMAISNESGLIESLPNPDSGVWTGAPLTSTSASAPANLLFNLICFAASFPRKAMKEWASAPRAASTETTWAMFCQKFVGNGGCPAHYHWRFSWQFLTVFKPYHNHIIQCFF